MHEGVSNYVGRWVGAVAHRGRALDIGGRDINGHPRALYPLHEWDVMDLRDGPGVTVVADATEFPEPPQRGIYNLVLSTETFEHVEHWSYIVRYAYLALRPGGWFITTAAGPGFPPHSGVDGEWRLLEGEHYQTVSAREIAQAMQAWGLQVVDFEQDGRFSYAAGRKVSDGGHL